MTDLTKTNRRHFLQTAAAATAATSLLSLPAGAYAGNDETLNVGLVGCGGRGSGAAFQALSTEGPVKLVAMADAFADNVEGSLRQITSAMGNQKDRVAVPPERRYAGFDAYQRIMEADDIDLVILATPPGFRPIHFEAAIAAGKHVFMEKPVATDVPGVRKVLAAAKLAKEKNRKVGVGLQRHHQQAYIETIKRLKDGAIGDIIAMRAYWNGAGVWDPRITHQQAKSEMEYQMRNWYYYNWLCGDHICEQHIHNLDVCNWLKDAYPVKALGMGGREVRIDPKYGEIFDHFAVEYTYADDSKMFSQCRHIPGCWNSVNEHAHGSKGQSFISRAQIDGPEKWLYRGPKPDPYQVEHDNLFQAIRQDLPFNEAENGAHSTMTAILGRLATYSGVEITLEEAMKSDVTLMPREFSFEADPPTMPDANGVYPVPVPGVTKVL